MIEVPCCDRAEKIWTDINKASLISYFYIILFM